MRCRRKHAGGVLGRASTRIAMATGSSKLVTAAIPDLRASQRGVRPRGRWRPTAPPARACGSTDRSSRSAPTSGPRRAQPVPQLRAFFARERRARDLLRARQDPQRDQPGDRRRTLRHRRRDPLDHRRRGLLLPQPGRRAVRPEREPRRPGLVPRLDRGRAALCRRRRVQRHPRRQLLHRRRARGVRFPRR